MVVVDKKLVVVEVIGLVVVDGRVVVGDLMVVVVVDLRVEGRGAIGSDTDRILPLPYSYPHPTFGYEYWRM